MKRKCSPTRGSHLETHQMGECYCNQEQHQSESLKRFKASYQRSVDRCAPSQTGGSSEFSGFG